jgi:hypothetical protein
MLVNVGSLYLNIKEILKIVSFKHPIRRGILLIIHYYITYKQLKMYYITF